MRNELRKLNVSANVEKDIYSMRTGKKYNHLYSSEKALAFERKLNQVGININPDSDLYRIGFDVLEVYEKHKNPDLHDNNVDIREEMGRVMGFNNFIEKVFPLLESEYVDSIKPHLELLNKSSIPQTIKAKVTDQGSNKLFELYTAALCYPEFNNISLDSPENSKGDNPDIMFDYNGKHWGIACKVLHSPKIKTIFDNIVKAVEQIENSNSDSGFVFISLKNIIDYDNFWQITNKKEFLEKKEEPLFASFSSVETPVGILKNHIFKIQKDLGNEIGIDSIVNLFKNKKAQPVIVFFLQAPTGIMKDGIPVFTLIGFLGMFRIYELDREATEVLEMINYRIH